MARCRDQLVLTLLLGLQILSHHKASAIGEACQKSVSGTCRSIRQCPMYLDILQRQGTAAGDFLRSKVCYFDDKDPIVCCPHEGQGLPWPLLPPTEAPQPVTPPPTFVNNSSYGPLVVPQCGFSAAEHNRVVGGVPAQRGAWPWIAALGYKSKKSNEIKFLCAGSLISTRHILTAGHCVYNRHDLSIARLGEHDITADNDGARPIDVPIERAVIHPGYSAVNYVNDVAVLRLKREVKFTAAIHPICLPVPPEIRNRDYVRSSPFVAGWGSLYFRGPTSTVLQEVQIPVVSEESCKRAFARFPNQVIDERVMCAGYADGGKDACQGDSGGSLMFPKSVHYYAIGIVSFGFRCGEPGFPGVYTRVSHFLDFITENMN